MWLKAASSYFYVLKSFLKEPSTTPFTRTRIIICFHQDPGLNFSQQIRRLSRAFLFESREEDIWKLLGHNTELFHAQLAVAIFVRRLHDGFCFLLDLDVRAQTHGQKHKRLALEVGSDLAHVTQTKSKPARASERAKRYV